MRKLLAGTAAIHEELSWFEAKGLERGLALEGAAPQKTCLAYLCFLDRVRLTPYATQAAVFWAIEKVYNDAWAAVTSGCVPEYQEYALRWGSPEFSAYVSELQQQADEGLEGLDDGRQQEVISLVEEMLRLEVRFWDMAMAAGDS